MNVLTRVCCVFFRRTASFSPVPYPFGASGMTWQKVLRHSFILWVLWLGIAALHGESYVERLSVQGAWTFGLLLRVLGAAFWEEALFRGLLFPAFSRVLPLGLALGLQAFLFAGLHDWNGASLMFQWAFFAGLYLGFLAFRQGSWGLGMCCHAVMNVLSLVS
jgi:membrane protease YdiL (CAAX protease family)